MDDGRFAAVLHDRGLRVTPQRRQVFDVVCRLGHATPEQIGESLPDVDLTTVYRTLELLEHLGLVRHTHLDHRAPTYRPGNDDHVHVVCHACGDVVDAPAALVDELERRLQQEHAFTLDRAHLAVFGRCRRCASPALGTMADAETRADAGTTAGPGTKAEPSASDST